MLIYVRTQLIFICTQKYIYPHIYIHTYVHAFTSTPVAIIPSMTTKRIITMIISLLPSSAVLCQADPGPTMGGQVPWSIIRW